jgi:hypothetical protein
MSFPASIAFAIIQSAAAAMGGDMQTSAELALHDARTLCANGEYGYAADRALKSLAYSVGIFSPVYQWAAAAIEDGRA